ncbi:MAG: hypothetical protein M5R40_14920 [Anaerolineae bacterium]|nr:hypothetical protein [Anaerolineae bacterium]
MFGPPLGDAQSGADGVLAQTFQNVRMELHHAAAGPRVRLTPLGAAVAPTDHPPEASQEGRCFAETGFCLVYDFLDFYDAHGGEAVFGVPRTPLFYDPEAGALVQYLDGARFEWDTAQQGVHLSPLGRWLVASRIPGYSDAGGD